MRNQKIDWKKMLSASAAGLFVAVPLATMLTAGEAKPPDHAPAWGYRGEHPLGKDKKDKKDKNKDHRDDGDHDDDDGDDGRDTRRRERNSLRSLTGTVTDDLSGDRFRMHTSEFGTITVFSRDEPTNLDKGDRVRVYGEWDGDVFYARNLRVIGDNYRDRSDRDRSDRDRSDRDRSDRDRSDRDRDDVRESIRDRILGRRDLRTYEGVVTDNLAGDSFRIRNQDAGTFVVRGNQPRDLDRGDTVRVYGYFEDGVFRAQNTRMIRNR